MSTPPNPDPPARGPSPAHHQNAAVYNAFEAHMREINSITQAMTTDVTINDVEETTNSEKDVLAIVTFPHDQSWRACNGEHWRDFHIRMSSKKLKALGSSKINKMFSDRTQIRFRRQHGISPLPPGINYLLDFTDHLEGEQLADLTAALWLPNMVKWWFLAGHYIPEPILEQGAEQTYYSRRPLADRAVGAVLALGHDDVCLSDPCKSDAMTPHCNSCSEIHSNTQNAGLFSLTEAQWETRTDVTGIFKEDPASEYRTPSFRKIADYCPIRHRVAIIRLLKAINGEDLLLNSAPRMWTVSQVAIFLEVPQVVVDPVTQWLIAAPNTKFIEICPEVAFKLAYELKIPSVLTHAFKLLVSENAVDYAATNPSPRRPATTWAQRKREDYDFDFDAIQYASRAMTDRIKGMIDLLRDPNALDKLGLQQWAKLKSGEPVIQNCSQELRNAHAKLMSDLNNYFRELVEHALYGTVGIDDQLTTLIQAQRQHYIPKQDIKPLSELYEKLNFHQRALTPFFWQSLRAATIISKQPAFHDPRWKSLSEPYLDYCRLLRNAIAASTPLAPIAVQGNNFFFNLSDLYEELCTTIQRMCNSVLRPRWSHVENDANSIPYFLSDHLLLNLEEKETDYLPIWAGGLDDGSGGVFQEVIPPAEMGPSEPGPAYHTGYTVFAPSAMTDGGDNQTSRYAPSTMDASDFGMDGLEIASTVGRSMDAQRSVTGTNGISNTPPRIPQNRIVALPSSDGVSEATPSASDWASEDGDYADAMMGEPAVHQAIGKALADYVEASESELRSSSSGDNNDMLEDNDDWDDDDYDFGNDDDDSDDEGTVKADDDGDEDGTDEIMTI